MLSFGADPYKADSVSWHVPGVATTVHSLFGFYTECALNHLQATLAENPNASASSIAWIGYDTPSGLGILRAAGHKLARTGGDLLHSDITAFNAARDVMAGDGSHFSGNHIFGYSYGSTTTGYAGEGGRLAGEITTVSLVGSPGAGPIRHAEAFGIGADHVFVASSSRDLVTALGGRTPHSSGRILGIGLGVDPAMDHFGAQRIAAEFPPARNQLLTGGTHHAYYLNTDTGSRVRSESLTNLGRIAAGNHEQISHEAHRSADGWRTSEPAAHRSEQRIWNPRWRDGQQQDARTDPDFIRRQDEYRAQDPANRHVDTRYADPLGDVVDNPTQDGVNRLARDLSGTYGPYRIQLGGEVVNGEVLLTGHIFHGDTEIGTIQRSFYRAADGNLVADHLGLVIREELDNVRLRGRGFSKALSAELERYYVHSGVDRIGLHTHDLGGFAWARRGFTWDPNPRAMQRTFDAIKGSVNRLRDHVGPEARAALDNVVRQLDPTNPRLPEPIDVANLATPDEPELGRRLLDGLASRRDGTGLDLVKYMPRETHVRPPNGFGARLKRLFRLGGDPRPDQDCAHRVADELSTRYYGRDFTLPAARSHMGTPAWTLFETARARAEFARYDDVPGRLRALGDGSSAILVSRWAGGRAGGHAYLAVNDGGEIYLHDPDTGERSAWPPHWGEDAVSHTAAGYLKPDGSPEYELNADPLQQQLADADLVGDVRGHPGDSEFMRRQADYRAQDLTIRHVDTRYAEPLGDVVDDRADGMAAARRLGDDLSGVYGPYRIRYDEVFKFDNEVRLSGDIYHGDTKIGRSGWIFHRAPDGHLVVTNSGLVIDAKFKSLRGQGFSRTLTSELERYFVQSGVDRIELHTHDKGGYAWPRMGYTWHPGSRELHESIDQVRSSAIRLKEVVGAPARAVLDDIMQRLDPNHPRLPEPSELANLTAAGEPELGRRLMEGSSRLNHGLNLVRYMPRDVADGATAQSHRGFGARLRRMIGMGRHDQSDQDCAHQVADELSAIYRDHGRDFRVATARSPMGTPAWALFDAINARPEFATYADVTAKLRPGWTAVLTSRWADGRSGGHAYLAVHDGHEISLYDPHTGERSGWPPHWGQDAVGRTAVAYLKPAGSAEYPLNDSPLHRHPAPADAVGDVRGHPSDPDFVRRQEEYRSQDPATRRVDSRYADPLGPAVDSASSAGAGRLAEDLSGVYGPYRLELEGLRRGPAQSLQDGGRPRVVIEGAIFDGNRDIGDVAWSIYRDDDGSLVAHHELYVGVDDFRGWEFSKALNEALAPYYVRNGVDQIVTTTLGESAYAAADLGHTWDPDPESLQISLDHVKESARLLSASLDDEARAVLDQIVQRLEPWHPRLPEPADLAHLTTFGEPELGRRLLEGTGSTPDGTGSGLNYVKYLWSERLQSDQNCASWVAEALSDRYGTPVSLDTPPAAEGVAARALFEAAGSRAEFATYDEIAARLLQMDPGKPGEPGPAAIVVSSWAGGESRGGHAYLAVRDGDRISLLDPFTGERSGWPPFWGESAVSRTAVGFFTSEGLPAQQLDGSAHELAAADAVGDVRGHPDDPEFLRRQADYRAQDPTSRTVDTRYAEPLADIVDNAPDLARVRQLADDLSGVFGPYRVEQFRAEVSLSNEVIVGGHIFSGDEYVGFMQRTFVRDVDGHLVAHHNVVEIDQERFKFKGFSRALSAQLEAYYERSGVDRIELRTEQDGGHVWAKRGFTWNTDPAKLRESLQSVKDAADRLYNWVSDDAKALLRRTVARLDPAHPRLPEPAELAALAVADEPDLGRQLMYGTQWHGVKHLRGAATESTTLLHSESDATVGRSVEDGAELRGANCAHLVAHELWEMYELEIELDPPTASGVPARALFEAAGTTAQFATYDEVANELRRLGPGSSAILASRWAGGRQGGHAYLAVNVGGDVFLVESHSGRQLGWPPYWGEDAVARTAVGYLDPDGVPPPGHELTPDIPLRLQLADAAAIGDVQGLPTDGVTAHADAPGGRYPSPDDVELAEFRDRIGQLDPSTMTTEAIADALYQPVPIDDVTGFYEGRVSGFKTGEVIRAQHHVADSRDNAVFVSADIANLRGLNQASADRVEANAHFSALAGIFHAGLVDSGADVVPMRVGGDELAAIVVGDIDEETIDSAVEAIRARVQEYARQHNLSDIPHPKHPGQPEYNGVGLHIGHADVLPGLDVRDVFNLADLGVDESKTRRSDVAGGPGRATGADGAEPGGAGAAHRGAATRTDSEAAGRAGEVGGRTGTEGEAGRSLASRVRYQQPEELKRAAFLEQAARIDRDAAPEALLALRESLRTDEVSGFYDGRAAAFKTGEVARARQWAAETGGTGFLLSAQMDNLSGLNQHTQNRAEVANAHYRAITEIFRTEIEATGATVVPMRTGGDRFDAIVVGRLDPAEVDAAIAAINDKVAAYTAREGLSDIANPSNPEQRGVSLRFGYADITAHRDVEGIVQSAERQMFGRNDSGDPRRVPVLEPDVEIPTPRQPAAAEDLPSPRTQEEYRAQDRTTRTTDTRFAEPLEDVLDNSADQRTVDQFAEDFSGVYGPYRVAFRAEGDGDVFLSGVIFRGTSPIGEVQLDFFRDPDGALVASVDWIEIFNDKLRQAGFSRSLISELERYCRSSDVTQIRLATQNNGGIAWARTGFTWDREPERLEKSLDSIKASAQRLRSELTGDARTVLDGIVDRLDPNRSDVPEPKFLTELTTRDVPDLGSRLMDGTEWFAVMNLQAADNHVQVSPENVFARAQDEYRGQDRAARVVDTRHADPLGDVVDNIDDVARVRQLAADLSGVYGPYRVELAVSVSDLEVNGKVVVRGEILKGAKPIGVISHSFFRDVDGKLVAHHDLVTIRDPNLRQKGFSSALYSELERYYVRSGVDRIELLTAEKGGFVWALRGFTWDPDPGRLRRSLDSIKESAQKLRDVVGPQGRAAIDDVVRQLNPRNPRLPEPRGLAALATADEPELGHKLLEGTHWRAVRHLPTADVDVRSHSGLGARLKRLFHLGGRPRTDQDCAHAVADELSAIYREQGREFRLAPSRSPMGTPAWALFKAAGTQAQFTDYDKVTETLRPGWTAILTSRWADGRSGGHTYLAVHDGVGVYLYDPETGQRSGWPPHWGEDAVARTAVGYLDENGIAVHPLGDVPLQLDLKAADVIGDVQGHPVEGGAQQQFAEEALSQRIPPVSAADLVHPSGAAELAVERARANAIWWRGLSDDLRQAMTADHPEEIGGAEGIPGAVRHDANMRVLQDWLRHRDQLQARRDAGFRLGFARQRELDFLNNVDHALLRGADAARQVGVDGPYLLRFDPSAFGGNGIAVVGFGVDPYLAESVSWHIPGRGMTIEQLGAGMGSALNQLSSSLIENPTVSAASITWIGYDTLAEGASRIGGDRLYSDIRAFNAGRDAWATDGSHFTNNHLFGHCQGSTVVGYAGEGARLDRAVRSVVLFGSPGMGPINHAREFGPGIDVYVAASSVDSFTWEGGRTPGSRGSFLDGFGVDPAMEFFGAQRVTAEFQLNRMSRAGEYDYHNSYYKFDDKSVGQRSEPLANFGRIGAGHGERIAHERHRTIVDLSGETRIHEPAATRSAVVDSGRPQLDPADNCAYGVAGLVSTRYSRSDIRIDVQPAPTGVPARALYEALGSRAEFMDYTRVAETLRPGWSAILTSTWAGVRHGGHAYLAVNDGGTIYLVDPRTGRQSGWPPYWGERAVAQTAVGFLDENGDPVHRLDGSPDELASADTIGDVQGGPTDPASQLGLPDYEPRSLSDVDAHTVYTHGEHRMRELNDQLLREGVNAEDRAKILFEQRNSLRAWTRDLMSNQTTAAVLAAHEGNHSFADLVARHEERGLTGDAVFEAIIETATHSRFAPGTLSDVETSAVYREFEDRMREFNERLTHEGVSVEERARKLSEVRNSLRAWTRELMSNRVGAEFLASHESTRSFDDLVARNEAKGLVGDDVYEAIIHTAINSHYGLGTLDSFETRTVYTNAELLMRQLNERLIDAGASIEERARIMSALRASVRTWTRELMADRVQAETLHTKERNPSFEDLVAKERARGREGDEIYQAIIESSTRSRPSVNEFFGIDPDNPPPLPPMRGGG
nr:toxin glutamine deamidase domain-containing protein [Mycobacterium sp. 3519A]